MSTTLDIRRPSPFVAEVWLNRPEVRNAFNDAVIAELTQAFTQLGADPSLRAIVLGGHGKAFCAGADLGWMRAMADYSWEENRADAQALADMLWTVYSCPLPLVGRIHGDCYAGGVGPGRGVRRAGRRRRRQLLPVRSPARPAAGDHRAVCGARARRAGVAALLHHRRTLRRGGCEGARLRARSGRCRGPRCQGGRHRRRAGGQRPGGRQGLQAPGAGRRRPTDRRRPARRHRAPHRRHPRQRRGPRGRAEFSRQARAGLAVERLDDARTRHDAAGRDRRGARLGQRPAPVRGGLSHRPGRQPGLGAAARGLACPAAAGDAVGQRRRCWSVEFFADKVPWVDSLWDAVHTFIRIPAGAALAYGVFGGDQASLGQRRRAARRHAGRHRAHGQGHHARGGQHLARAVFQPRAVAGRRCPGARHAVAVVGAPGVVLLRIGRRAAGDGRCGGGCCSSSCAAWGAKLRGHFMPTRAGSRGP